MRQLDNLGLSNAATSKDEKVLLMRLGSRIVERCKAHDINQVQMVGNSDEMGRRSVPVSALHAQAKLLGLCCDELVGEQPKQGNRERGAAPQALSASSRNATVYRGPRSVSRCKHSATY